jgi:AcrR family transcriptional regulator
MAAEPAPRAHGPRRLRRDAAHNQERIVEAARVVFAARGVDVALEEIAKQAGVGLATLHRRFTREELTEAVFTGRAAEYLQIAEQAINAPDGWTGFAGYLERLCEIQQQDRSLSDVLTLRMPDYPAVSQLRDQIYWAQLKLIQRAQREGTLRGDLVPEDVILLLLATGGIISATAGTAPHSWRRTFALITASMRADHAQPLPAPPTTEDLLAALNPPRRGRRPGNRPSTSAPPPT